MMSISYFLIGIFCFLFISATAYLVYKVARLIVNSIRYADEDVDADEVMKIVRRKDKNE